MLPATDTAEAELHPQAHRGSGMAAMLQSKPSIDPLQYIATPEALKAMLLLNPCRCMKT